LQYFLPGDSPAIRELRGMIYRLNVLHKSRRLVPSILLLGERGTGKGYLARIAPRAARAIIRADPRRGLEFLLDQIPNE
jgi:hypothetical protein